jgi:hypothetical protein
VQSLSAEHVERHTKCGETDSEEWDQRITQCLYFIRLRSFISSLRQSVARAGGRAGGWVGYGNAISEPTGNDNR